MMIELLAGSVAKIEHLKISLHNLQKGQEFKVEL